MLAKLAGVLLTGTLLLSACGLGTTQMELPTATEQHALHTERQHFEERLTTHTTATLLALTCEDNVDIATYKVANEASMTVNLLKGTPTIQDITLHIDGPAIGNAFHYVALAVDPTLTIEQAATHYSTSSTRDNPT
ncbi:hypothetical protein CH76_10310 [Lysinibacillus sp. BF-4]|uniref:hypothetical protein n=1 Tax=Lysinibacillus sp. BF-4 TaxID=1473546 RepID=UPI000506A347|nr:hypothetical protein [Lysinibacillus sp. BF-4]KFL42773.1 hypothetical protein CH76_10310 [Lysinibacillus sp. BF-4]